MPLLAFFALALSSEVFVCAFIYRNRLTNIFFITPITLEHNTTIALRSSNPTTEPIRTSGTTSQPTNQPTIRIRQRILGLKALLADYGE